jgi:hypothetical protein
MPDVAVLALVFTVFCNVVGLVWGAAKLAASVKELTRSVDRLDRTIEIVDNRSQNNKERIAVLEAVV